MVNINPKKELGQHWLYDQDVLEAMCDAIDASEADNVLEIGPGLGTLTTRLLMRGSKVRALEFDNILARDLKLNVTKLLHQNDVNSSLTRLEIIEGDIRTFDFTTMPTDFKVCANIPYYLTSNLIRLLCDTPNQPKQIAILVQKEVAERVTANNGKMSILACVAQFYYDCELGDIVPAKLFTPPPKVDSRILIMKKKAKPQFDVDSKEFFKLIKAGFGEKRKTLRNSLSGGLRLTKDEAVKLLKIAKIEPMLRAESLTLADWYKIYQNYNNNITQQHTPDLTC